MRYVPMIFLLSGCSTLSPEAARLSNINPLAADPANFAIVVDLDERLGIQTKGVTLTLSVENEALGQASGQWQLAELSAPDGTKTYRVAKRDLDDMRRIQATANAWESRDPKGTTGSLGLFVTPCKNPTAEGFDGAVMSAFLQVEPDSKPLQILKDAPVSRVLPKGTLDDVPDCA